MSNGGRLTLIKSALTSIPNNYLLMLKIPESVANKIEALFRTFLWNELDEHRRFHLVD